MYSNRLTLFNLDQATLRIYFLHNLQLFTNCSVSFIIDLKIGSVVDSFISFESSCHIFGPIISMFSVPKEDV